jgi:hypothetical protein
VAKHLRIDHLPDSKPGQPLSGGRPHADVTDTFVTLTLSGKDNRARMRADANVAPAQTFDFAVNGEKAVACNPVTEYRGTE